MKLVTINNNSICLQCSVRRAAPHRSNSKYMYLDPQCITAAAAVTAPPPPTHRHTRTHLQHTLTPDHISYYYYTNIVIYLGNLAWPFISVAWGKYYEILLQLTYENTLMYIYCHHRRPAWRHRYVTCSRFDGGCSSGQFTIHYSRVQPRTSSG